MKAIILVAGEGKRIKGVADKLECLLEEEYGQRRYIATNK